MSRPTARAVMLAAARGIHARGAPDFASADLAVAAWGLDPGRFGMRGYADAYPDHKRVAAELSKARSAGLVERVTEGSVSTHPGRHMSTFWDAFAPPAQRHSDTSAAAADAVAPTTGVLRARVLEAIRAAGGATDEEVQEATGIGPSTQRPRRVELVAAGRVRDGGRRRKTRSGRAAVVWEAV